MDVEVIQNDAVVEVEGGQRPCAKVMIGYSDWEVRDYDSTGKGGKGDYNPKRFGPVTGFQNDSRKT